MRRQQEIQTKLRAYLRECGLRPGDRLPGEREIAAALGVGRTGLRPALDALEAEGALERRPQSGTFLTSAPPPGVYGLSAALIAPFGKTDEIDRHHDAIWLYRVASAFERIAVPAGLRILAQDQSPHFGNACSVKEMALAAVGAGVQAVVLLHPLGTRAKISHALALLHDRGVQSLIVSSRSYPGLASQVYFDSGWGSYLATRHLLQKGHIRIGFAGSPSGHEWVQDRLNSYRGALEAADIAPCEAWTWLPEAGERLADSSDGVSAFRAWSALPKTDRPTAVVAANDVVALGFLKAARENGVDVPGHLSLIGFDNDPESLLAGLTTVERPTETLGETVARVLLERLTAGQPSAETVSVRLRPVLIERSTVTPPGA